MNIKNIVLLGHNGSGKTSLAEAIFHTAKVSDRFGKTSDGTTVLDYEAEEIKRKFTITTAVGTFDYAGGKISLIDTPGMFDFIGGMYEGVAAANAALIAVSAKSGVKVGTIKAFNLARKLGKPVGFVITGYDDPNANFDSTLDAITEKFGSDATFIDLNADLSDLAEKVAETDESLMDKFFEEGELSKDEIITGLKKGIADGGIYPVFKACPANLDGVPALLTAIDTLFPNETLDEDAPLSLFVFKTIADPFVGKLSYAKVMSGKLKENTEITNATTGDNEKIAKFSKIFGKKNTDIQNAVAGEIIAVPKLSANTSDTLYAKKEVKYPEIDFPKPCYSLAIKAKSQDDEAKIGTGFHKLLSEDKCLSYARNSVTNETIFSGLGDQHLEVSLSKLKTKFGAEVVTSKPKIAYKETITKHVRIQGRHKKQSGGAGQFGDVWIEFDPTDSEELVFEEKIFGGSVPKNFFPAVQKGLEESVKKGVLAGQPVVGIKATLVDGSYHPVDSKEIAFVMAAKIAFKNGVPNAGPIMLEPIGMLNVTVPDSQTGDVMGELNKRRGRVLGMNPSEDPFEKGQTTIQAEVPMMEMQDFSLYLRQVTRGMGYFVFDFLRYDPLPAMLKDSVIESIVPTA
ncbi:MAG: elongation factor G [Ruminococcus sp.]|jgi:elongation factor G|nr:elongation factor G [Ruminococcus sp.]